MWLSFSDALIRYGSGLKENDLGEADRKAGITFKGQLKQNFVVLPNNFETPMNGNRPQTSGELDARTPRK
jgi:hypothetical protein